MQTFKKHKWLFSTLTMVLAFVTAFYFGGQSFQNRTKQELRTVTLEQTQIDYQSILDGFDDAELTIDGTFLDFVGSQKIDASVFEELDNLSVSEKEELQGNNIQYHFTYDIETNIITISAEITLPNGEIIFDTISGVGFYDENGEIDAVMNVDGEGILLSEMRNAGMIGNVGLFSRILKAIAVVAVAVVAVVVAVVVVTAGAAAPALVAAGVGVVGAAGGTAAIAGTALTVAVIAAGVAVVAGSALVIDNALQNIGYNTSTNTYSDVTSKFAKIILTVTTATLAEITMVRCYYFAYLANGGLIKNTIALNYVEAYAVLVGAGFINLSSLSGNLFNSVKNSILPQSLIDYIGTLKNNKSIKKGYFGIYTQIDTDAAKLAYATGAIFKDTNGNIFSETHDKTVGSGYYYHFHDTAHLIHVWYGNPI